jgi:dihydropyrimidinase
LPSQFDLVIRGGRVVTAGSDSVVDVGVQAGRIAQLGGEMSGANEIDATGKLVLPGGIDAHVHLSLTEEMLSGPAWCDDFASGTAAAAAGGITAVGNMTFPRSGETLADAIARESADAEAQAIVDVFLHPVLTDPASQPLDDIESLAAEGVTSLKFFMSFGGFAVTPAPYLEAMRRAAAAGCITLIHCEDEAIMADALRNLVANGMTGIEHYPAARPVTAEAAATARAVAFAQETGAPTYIVHLSSEGALDEVRRGRERGAQLWIETRPLYLHLTEERFQEPQGEKYVGQPPLRTLHDRVSLWNALAAGEIDTVCTDHAPWRMADKITPGMDLRTLRPGVADLDTMLPMLFSEGVVAGRISAQQFVAVSSTNAAKLFGLFPRKGTIAVGSDADIAIWDPELTKPIRATDLQTNSDYSPYEGWAVTGWPVATIHGGEVVYRDGQVLGKPGRAGIVKRDPVRGL